jgi:hypothetical protein
MTFEEAISAPGPGTFQVWGSQVKNGKRGVMIYRLGHDGANLLARQMVPEGQCEALRADLEARGMAVAETDFHCDFIWIRTSDGIEVYGEKRRVFVAGGGSATLIDGRTVARGEIARVIAYAEDDFVDRGIKAILASGDEVDLVTELSMSASGDPSYSRNELLMETEWCATIGHAIARWAGKELENQILFPRPGS